MDHKIDRSSKSTPAIFDLTTEFERSFQGKHACNLEESQKICFRQSPRGSRSCMEVDFLTRTHNSRFFWKPKSRAIAGSIPASRTLDCAQDGLILMSFRPLGPENEVIFGLMVNTYFVVSRLLTCNRLLCESFLAETIGCRSAASLKSNLLRIYQFVLALDK